MGMQHALRQYMLCYKKQETRDALCVVALLHGNVQIRRFVMRGLSVMLVTRGAGEKIVKRWISLCKVRVNDVTTPSPTWVVSMYQTQLCRERHGG